MNARSRETWLTSAGSAHGQSNMTIRISFDAIVVATDRIGPIRAMSK
jgi:hypothetical protein